MWATAAEVTSYLELDEPVAQHDIDKAVRTLEPKCLRMPLVGDDERALDETIRSHLIAAVAELIGHRRATAARDASLGGHADLIDRGGSIDAGTLKVSGSANRNGTGYDRAAILPAAVFDALLCAGVIGGSVPSW